MDNQFKFSVGDRVNYHPIIGGRSDGKTYEIRSKGWNYSEAVYWLNGKAGFVAEEALSEVINAPN